MLHEGESQPCGMARRLTAPTLTLLITLVLLGVTSSPVLTSFADTPVVSSTEAVSYTHLTLPTRLLV